MKDNEEDFLPCFEFEGERAVKSREIFYDLSAADGHQPKRTEKSEDEQYCKQRCLHDGGRVGKTRRRKKRGWRDEC